MASVLEISSDSSDTIIMSSPDKFGSDQKLNETGDVENLVNKYILDNCSDVEKENAVSVDWELEDKFLEEIPLKRKRANFNFQNDGDEYGELQMLRGKYSTNQFDMDKDVNLLREPTDEKTLKQQDKEIQKQTKIEEKEQKKREAEREKLIKQATATANKNIKPTECIKFITTRIDNEIIREEYGSEILKFLQETEVEYKIESQIFPGTITWTRKLQSHSLDNNEKLVLTSEEQDTNQVVLIMNPKKILTHIQENTLSGYIQSVKSVLNDKKLTLAVYGLNTFLKKSSGKSSTSNDLANISKTKIDYSLTELQIMCSCSHRLFESPSDVGLFIAQFTKAVAEIPFKLQRHEQFLKNEWFVAGDNRDSVKVDKNGIGLNRLWKQMLTTFPLARLETAEAIAMVYPTVSSLMTAYEQCSSKKEAELLLQEIPIRRAAGPLSSSRKIGPELSKKIHNFFTSSEGDCLI